MRTSTKVSAARKQIIETMVQRSVECAFVALLACRVARWDYLQSLTGIAPYLMLFASEQESCLCRQWMRFALLVLQYCWKTDHVSGMYMPC